MATETTQAEMPPRILQERWRLRALALSAGVVTAASFLLAPTGATGGVRLPGDVFLPPTCPMRFLTGVPCPFCGLTRGFVNTAHGHLADAFTVHPLSPLLFGLTVLLLLWAVYRLLGGRGAIPTRWLRHPALVGVVVAAFAGAWVWRLANGIV